MAGYGHVERYVDDAGDWRWRAVAGNGETVADSAEGYEQVQDLDHGLDVLARILTQGQRDASSADVRTVGRT